MTDEQKILIMEMRSQGIGYKRIATALQLSENTVKTFLRRNKSMIPLSKSDKEKPDVSCCPQCGKTIEQTPGRKLKRFCSTECRLHWWNTHPGLVSRKAFYMCTCLHCGNTFKSYGRDTRKYCGRKCYLDAVQRTVD